MRRNDWRTGLLLWVAQGGGSGRIPVAPGTFGSLPGLAWFGVLLLTGDIAWFLLGAGVSLLPAAWVCGKAEALLGRKDPNSVVLDEIVAVPLACVGWVVAKQLHGLPFPSWTVCFTGSGLLWTAGGFGLFRLLDALKPPPVRWCERLPAGWGIVADDVVAGLLSGLVLGILAYWFGEVPA